MPGLIVELEGVRIKGMPAYNPNKQYHPKKNNWLGFIIGMVGKQIYYAGDTDLTDEMKAIKDIIDVALLPVGGVYTMNGDEAAEATKYFKPRFAIPYHWGDIVGGREDAERFASLAGCDVKVLLPGDMFSF